MPVCPNCNEDNPERAKFCLNCGAPLGEPAAPKHETRRTVTIIFTDVAGFTSTAERSDPEALRSFMTRYFERMAAVVDRHGGVVEKFIGDAVMAVFGIREIHEDDALRAVRAAWDMREALSSLNEELEAQWAVRLNIRTGVNTGEVVAGDPASGQSLVVGDAVNVAARLEQNAPAGEILIGEPTWRLVRDAVSVEAVEVAAKGKSEPVKAYRLTNVSAGAPGVARRADAPMVGRDHEQSLMMQAFERAVRERSCHLFTILGSAGVGKSRLMASVVEALEDQATVLSGRCLPYGDGITFFPLLEAIPEVAGVRDDDPAEVALEKIANLVRGDEHAARITELVGRLLDLADAPGSLEEQFWAVRRLFEHLARQRPLIVVFDDIHWAEPTFLDLVEHVADWTRDAPIMLTCLARQELFDRRPGWGGGKFNATSMHIEPLTEKECARLIEHLLGQTDIDPAVRDRITEAAEGNPLFVEETLSMLIDHGALVRSHDRWVTTSDLSTVEVPPTIHALLAARIDRLRPEERAVLERASIVGKVFWRGSVLALSDDADRSAVDANLMVLVRKELVRQDPSTFAGEDSFRFRHILIRDAAYTGIAKQVRADLHERFAQWLAVIAGDRVGEYEEILAYHYEQAYRNLTEIGAPSERTAQLGAEAARRLGEAGTRAVARGDFPAAEKLFSRAVALLAPGDPDRLRAQLFLAETLAELGRFDESSTITGDVLAAAEANGDTPASWLARVHRGHLRYFVDAHGATAYAEEVGRQAVEFFSGTNDDMGLAKAWKLLAVAHWTQAHATETRSDLEHVLEHARRAGDRAEISQGVPWLFIATWYQPITIAEAMERVTELATHYPAGGVFQAQIVEMIRANILAEKGQAQEAREILSRARAALLDVGSRVIAASSSMGAGAIEAAGGNFDEAERILRWGCDELRAMGEQSYFSTAAAQLASVLVDLGRIDEAEEWCAFSRSSGDPGDVATQAGWRSALARVAARRGRPDEVERLTTEALDELKNTDFLHITAALFRDLGDANAVVGHSERAAELYSDSIKRYELKGMMRSSARVRRESGELMNG